MEKRVELLAPAGNLQCFKAAINAGADAVYMGGSKFGARAYADNFSDEELIEAIQYGHLFHKKIYLTLNTLLKDMELSQVTDYVKPFYEAGLDGVIIQDFGVLSLLKEQFPGMELHASTQMTVTGKEGAALLKYYGVCRIVPARELSLNEIKDIKKEVDIEIETFIHGAMCYAYSGQCLFSSMLGGRSGNRGRCAGPCRLPYDGFCEEGQLNRKKEQYLLSLKDMCSITLLPKLIEAGIDSFKIEGRMKSPEYVAGVTAIYRKYIDEYYENRKKSSYRFNVRQKDLELLKKLYVRSDLETGYYEKHNGSGMVTLSKPCYETGSKEELNKVTEEYINKTLKIPVWGKVILETGQPAVITIETSDNWGKTAVLVKGSIVQQASNRPLDMESVKKQLLKTGGTCFEFENLDITLGNNCFLSIKELNDLRRQALDLVFLEITKNWKRSCVPNDFEKHKENDSINVIDKIKEIENKETFHIVVATYEQLEALDGFLTEIVNGANENSLTIKRISVSSDLFGQNQSVYPVIEKISNMGIEISLSFPKVVRKNTLQILEKQLQKDISCVSSFLVGNLELLHYFRRCYKDKWLYGDYSLYSFNKKAYEFLLKHGIRDVCMPYEWSRHEIASFKKHHPDFIGECIVYSYIPLMESAGCILKTTGNCLKEKANGDLLHSDVYLLDRYKKKLSVKVHCNRCENTIYNSVPYSLHKKLDELRNMGIKSFRMDFTIETKEQTLKTLRFFSDKEKREQPFYEFTNGHFGKGVE